MLPLRRAGEGHVPRDHDVPGARRLPERLLGVVDPTPSERAARMPDWTALRSARIKASGAGAPPGVPRGPRRLWYTVGQLLERKRVARLIEAHGPEGVHRRRAAHTTVRDREPRAGPDLVNRVFRA